MSDKLLIKIKQYPHLLGYLAGKILLTNIHSQWIKYIWDTEENRSLQGHRGSYKTTAITIIGSIYWLLLHPDDRIAIIRKTYTDACECISTISKIMKLPVIRYVFRTLHGRTLSFRIDRKDKLEFTFKSSNTPEGSIDAYGIDTSITGKHYDKIICDDFVTLRDRVSKAERDKTKDVIREIQTNIIDPGKQVGFIGTPWHKDDAWGNQTKEFPGIVPFPQKWDVYSTGILDEIQIQKKRAGTTGSLYAANYELKHIISEDALFKNATFSNWNTSIRSSIFGHIDAKFSGDHTNAFTMMYQKSNGRLQAIGFSFHENIKEKWNYIKSLWERYYCGTIYIEENADKGFVADELRKRGIPVKTYWEDMNKHVKISTYLCETWDNIDFDSKSDPEYINQILDYIEGQEPDDSPDSIASLVRQKFYKKSKNTNNLWSR